MIPTTSFEDHRDNSAYVYHYTGAQGLLGILQRCKIRATSARHLNDASEILNHPESLLGDLLPTCIPNDNELPERLKLISECRALLPIISRYIFLTSFSERGDLLSQWRGYCPNGGFAIGFPLALLSDLANANDIYLTKCVYDDEVKAIHSENIANEMARRIESKAEDGWNGNPDISAKIIGFGIGSTAGFKPSGFEEEHEWRLVRSTIADNPPQKNLKFLGQNGRVRPFIELEFPPERLEDLSVVVAPGEHQLPQAYAAWDLLRSLGVEEPKISLSTLSLLR